MRKTCKFFEVRSLDDLHGLSIANRKSAEKAIEAINRAYEHAKSLGCDNISEKWLIVCNKSVKEFDEKGVFIKEERTRFVAGKAVFSTYENEFVFVY